MKGSIAGIVKEMREYAEHRDFDSDGNMDVSHLRRYADRIEAAWQLDRSNAIKAAMMAKCEVCGDVQGNSAALRQALNQLRTWALMDINENAASADETNYKKILDGIVEITNAALAAPPRNCDLIENELNIDPERVPEALNKCENAPIRELIRWIFAKAEGRREISKPTPEESAVADVARNVAADMRCMELQCWQGRRMGAYAVALMLDGFASRLEGAYNLPPRKEGGAQ